MPSICRISFYFCVEMNKNQESITSLPSLQILVCNDDGVTSKGIETLAKAMQAYGKVIVVAPDSPQSGMGHAISVGKPLRIDKIHSLGDIEAYACNGTPVDCVKLATGIILGQKPDLLVSGINHGLNSSINVFYSGTMSAALEGAIEGIPSVGFSLDDFSPEADFTTSQIVVKKVIDEVLRCGLPRYSTLNVNIPNVTADKLKGIKICRQAIGRWVEEFDERVDPFKRTYYWLTGKFKLDDDGEDTDIWALNNGYASVCPVESDATAHHHLGMLNQWNLKI